MKKAHDLLVGPPPYIFNRQSTPSIIWGTVAALSPALAWGLYSFGISAAAPVLASLLAAAAAEGAVCLVTKRFTLWDGSAVLTGLLVSLAMPPGVPLYVPVISAAFAVVVVKGIFGGLGSNWMNPALGGVAFAILNWPQEMRTWILPRQLDGTTAVSGATPLGLIQSRLITAGSDASSLLGAGGMPITYADTMATGALNQGLFSRLGAELPSGYIDLLIGNRTGTLGELSGLLILAASVFIISRKFIRWQIPASMIGSFTLLVWIFGGLPFGRGFLAGDVLFALLNGSLLLVAFFMAPDPVTSPSSRWGMLAFGFGAGSLTFLLRQFGSSSEGTTFAVLIMNCFTPLLDRPRGLGRRGAPQET